MANNEKKTAAELALKRNREQSLTGKVASAVAGSVNRANRRGAEYGAAGRLYSAAEDVSKIPALVGRTILNPPGLISAKETVKKVAPFLIGSKGMEAVGLGNQTESPAASTPAGVPAGAEGMSVRPADAAGMTVRPAPDDPLGTSGFTAQVSGGKERPLTRYEDGKGSFLEASGTRKGGGTVSVVSGPGSNDFTKEEWEKMSGAQRTQANVDSYKAQTQAIRDSMAGPRQAGTASGGALTGQQSPFERRKTLREYGMATSELKNDLRRGRISAKKGKVIAATLMDHYDKVLGGDLQKLMQEETRQGGQLMTQQARNQGAVEVAEAQTRNTAPEFIKPLGYEIEQGDAYGGSPYVLNRDTGETRTLGQGEGGAGTELQVVQNLLRQKIEALPEEQKDAGRAEFARRFPGVEY